MDISAAGTPAKLIANDGTWTKFQDGKGKTHTMPTGQIRTLGGSRARQTIGPVNPPKTKDPDFDPFSEVQ